MSERDEAIARLHAITARLRRRAVVRDHFHAGAMAAIEALSGGTAEEQAERITRACDEYAEQVEP